MKRLLLVAGVLTLLVMVTTPAQAGAEDHVNDALSLSMKWIDQIDAGKYDESYDFGGDAFRDKVPQTRWTEVLKALRTPLGPVASRTQVSHVFKPDGFEGASGEFMVITYDTSFAKMPGATEVVVLRWEGGEWRGAGYHAGIKQTPDNETAQTPTPSSTEVTTQMHVKPQPQTQ